MAKSNFASTLHNRVFHGGKQVENLRYITNYTNNIIIALILLLIFVTVLLLGYWIYNRRKFHQLSHQIPASVVKNYLDSIIQNSTALKSSLFRGGGLDITDGIPSVVPVQDLPKGQSVDVGTADLEEVNKKNAEIASLNNQLNDKQNLISELEKKLADSSATIIPDSDSSEKDEEISILKQEIEDLQAQLKEALASSGTVESGGDEELTKQLTEVTKERDELKERLMEYEIIEEDLANLKRLQQENEELKKQINGDEPSAPPVEEDKKEEVEEKTEDAPEVSEEAPSEEEDLEAMMAAAITDDDRKGIVPPKDDAAPDPEPAPQEEGPSNEEKSEIPENDGEQKSAEELLSEFEKMLG